MRNTLHFLLPCLRLLPADKSVFLILNGARKWEYEHIRKAKPELPIFELTVCPFSYLSHGTVLSMLFEHNDTNFGVIDSDLFIFDECLFEQLNFRDNEYALSPFEVFNERLNLRFPTTHFMFFNVPIIKGIIAKYDIDAREAKKVPTHLCKKLKKLGLGHTNFLKSHLNYFDTFNLISAVALSEGLSSRILNIAPNGIGHVGKVSYFHTGRPGLGSPYLFVVYTSLRFLEFSFNSVFRSHYQRLFQPFQSAEEVLEEFRKRPSAKEYIAKADTLVGRLNSQLSKME